MNQEDILLDVTDGIATVPFNPPEKRNPMGLTFSANLEVEAYLQSYAFRTPEHKQRIGEYRDRLGKKGS